MCDIYRLARVSEEEAVLSLCSLNLSGDRNNVCAFFVHVHLFRFSLSNKMVVVVYTYLNNETII